MADISVQLDVPSLAPPPTLRPRSRRRIAMAAVLWSVFLINAGVIIALWLSGGGISAVHGWGDLFTSVGRITGLLGAYLLLVQVVLIARLPSSSARRGLIVRPSGTGGTASWPSTSSWRTSCSSPSDTPARARISITDQALSFWQIYPGIASATIGTILMIVIVLTSLVIVRRRLRYEVWYLVHLTAYLAIGLAWIHQIPTGNDLVPNPAAANYWIALYLATLAILLIFRLGRPAFVTARHGLRSLPSPRETRRGLPSPLWPAPQPAGLQTRAVLSVSFPRARAVVGTHPFSLSAAPNDFSFRITVKESGISPVTYPRSRSERAS